MPLTDVQIRNAKAGEKQIKLSDGDGMYLLVTPAGGKYWRLKYRISGKEKVLALGVYPEVPLRGYYMEEGNKDSWIDGARDLCAKARKQLAAGVDPGELRKARKATSYEQADNSFEVVAREWHGKFVGTWSAVHAATLKDRLEKDVFP
ncbi:MAG: Arm DNA-binding domain-containing protein, partial [Nitrospirota bacterium]|nr:Arm DNA-binding domain-containing protein [Nitrospirota bacterium]